VRHAATNSPMAESFSLWVSCAFCCLEIVNGLLEFLARGLQVLGHVIECDRQLAALVLRTNLDTAGKIATPNRLRASRSWRSGRVMVPTTPHTTTVAQRDAQQTQTNNACCVARSAFKEGS